jgi:mannan polymerase II complex MNN11 subunit
VIIVLFTFLFGIFLLSRRRGGPDPYHEHEPTGNPPVVIVTVVDPSKFSGSYIKSIKENREQYARKHGTEKRTLIAPGL